MTAPTSAAGTPIPWTLTPEPSVTPTMTLPAPTATLEASPQPTAMETPSERPTEREQASATPTITFAAPTATLEASPQPTLAVTETPRQTPTERGPQSPTPTRITGDIPVEKLVLQEGLGAYTGVDDTYLDAWLQTSNMGDQSTLEVRQHNIRTALLRYDLRSIPQDSTVREATLNLWVDEVTNPSTMCLQIYMLRRPWQEDAATWIEAASGTTWADGGASGTATDYEARLVDDISFQGAQQWLAIDIAPAVQYWVQHPEANYGLLIKGVGPTSQESRFASSQWSIRQQRPRMLLTYESTPIEAQSTWTRALQHINLLQGLGIVTGAIAILLLLVAAGIPSKARSRR